MLLKVNNVNISSVRFPHAGTAVFRIRRFIRNFTRKNPNNDNNERNFNQPFQRLLGYTSAGQHVTGNRKPYPQRCMVRDRTEKHRYYSHNGQKAAAHGRKPLARVLPLPCASEAASRQKTSRAGLRWRWQTSTISTPTACRNLSDVSAPTSIRCCPYTTISGTGLRIIYRDGLPDDHSGEEPESLFQNLRAGQPLLCRPAGMRMRPEMQEYHETQRTGTRPDVYFNPDAAMPVELKGDKKRAARQILSIRNRRLEKAVAAAAGESAEWGHRLRSTPAQPIHHAHGVSAQCLRSGASQRYRVGGETLCRLRRGCSRVFRLPAPEGMGGVRCKGGRRMPAATTDLPVWRTSNASSTRRPVSGTMRPPEVRDGRLPEQTAPKGNIPK